MRLIKIDKDGVGLNSYCQRGAWSSDQVVSYLFCNPEGREGSGVACDSGPVERWDPVIQRVNRKRLVVESELETWPD